jgi:hypothetical protein
LAKLGAARILSFEGLPFGTNAEAFVQHAETAGRGLRCGADLCVRFAARRARANIFRQFASGIPKTKGQDNVVSET